MVKLFVAGVVVLISGQLPDAYAQGTLSSFQSGTALIEECLSDSPKLQPEDARLGNIAAECRRLTARSSTG